MGRGYKDVYVKKGRKEVPMLGMLASQLERGVDVRLIHAKEFARRFVRISTSTP